MVYPKEGTRVINLLSKRCAGYVSKSADRVSMTLVQHMIWAQNEPVPKLRNGRRAGLKNR